MPAPVPAGPVGPVGPATGSGGASTSVSGGGATHGSDLYALAGRLADDALAAPAALGSVRGGSGPDRSPAGRADNPGARPD
jgi:hypothetical protein